MGADSVEGVADVVTENLLAVLALEEVVTVGVEGPGAEAAGCVGEGLGEDGQAKFALVEKGEGVIVQAVVLEAAVVAAEGDTGEVGEEGDCEVVGGSRDGGGEQLCAEVGVDGRG